MPGTFASPFASSSLWNTPIAQLDPTYSDPGSIEDVQFRDTSLANTWASVENIIYDTPANAPLVTWTYSVLNQTPEGETFSTNGTIQLPTPTNIAFGNGSDGWAIFSDPDGVHYWEVWEGSYNSVTNTYQAAYMVEGNYVSGSGWGQNGEGAGVRASGASLLGGIVTQAELNNLSINHALSIELAPTQLEAGASQSDQFVFPAVSADSDSVEGYTGSIPMGAHFALPSNLDLADAGLTPEGLALAEAYQTYGGYVVDSATDTTSLAQIEGGTSQQISDIDADLTWIRDHLVMVSTPSPSVIQTDGSTSLVQVGSNYYFDNISTGTGPELKLYGAAVLAGQFGTIAPIGAVQTASGYDVAWKVPGADQYIVWSTDSSGNYLSAITGPNPVSGSSTILESLETVFNQDLNGDGSIGSPVTTSVIQTDGSTSLVQVGSNYYFDSTSTGTGPELKLYGAAVLAGQFGTIVPIGAVQTASGYDVAWKVSGADQYIVWTTDSSGNYLSAITGPSPVSGSSTILESLETIFHQDLNGDGIIGVVTPVATGAMVELTGASIAVVQFVGTIGTLVLDQSVAFTGQINNFSGNGSLSGSDQLDLKDIVFAAGVSDSYAGNSSGGVLTVSDAQNHVAHIALSGDYIGSTFSLSSDGNGGTVVVDPVVPDLASGKLSLGEAQSSDTYSVEVSPENENFPFIGNFTVDAPNVSNGQVSTGWHFNFDETNTNQQVTQSYNVSLVDTKPSGMSQTTSQTVSVTIGGPGQDSFIFHPGVGTEIVANAKSTDTIELDGFSAVTNNHQLATLLQEAQAGISQSVFSSANDGHDTTINLGNHDSITLAHIQLANLHANNFIVN
jgi:hypothetical protein